MDHGAATGPSVFTRWWGPTTTVANVDAMNQLCRVCAEPAAGFHFGAFTCEGCKSFFGRTYNNMNSVSECRNNGECVINKKNRTSCKACRLRKCLLVGMSKSGSRYGRRSNWFKIHCLLQEQQLQHQQHQQHHQSQQLHRNQYPPSTKNPWEYAKTATALFDIDNNNTPIDAAKSEILSSSFTSIRNMDTSTFWAPRQPSLTIAQQHELPYLISPFLHSPTKPVSHNYFLPFLPLRPSHPRPPLAISSLHSSSSLMFSPIEETTIPEHMNKRSLDMLISLGPAQEQPIDLSSSKVVDNSVRLENDNNVKVELSPTGDKDQNQIEYSGRGVKSTTPLDLRCSRSSEAQ